MSNYIQVLRPCACGCTEEKTVKRNDTRGDVYVVFCARCGVELRRYTVTYTTSNWTLWDKKE